jgi:hypothetical protein
MQQKDIAGHTFGLLKALRPITKAPNYYWECECNCGVIKQVAKGKLISGNTVSCGCKKKQPKICLSGKKYGRLSVLYRLDKRDTDCFQWMCLCDCGGYKITKQTYLIKGTTQSCGCLHKEGVSMRNTSHGYTGTYTYKKWRGMITRVNTANTNEKNKCYRDIKIDPRWLSFKNFIFDMGECEKGFSLDRINNNEGYNKDNCRWIPIERQAANTSRNIFTVFNGITATLSDHAKQQNIKPDVVFDRINKLGWSVEDALSTPIMGIGKKRTTCKLPV